MYKKGDIVRIIKDTDGKLQELGIMNNVYCISRIENNLNIIEIHGGIFHIFSSEIRHATEEEKAEFILEKLGG